jgi:HAD superfamily hydrolase (TIGR01509 family)
MRALIFDLDGTLVDTVYAHVLAWQRALAEAGVAVEGHRIHHHVGSSGDLILQFAQRESGRRLSPVQEATVHRRHSELFRMIAPCPLALPGALEVLRALRGAEIPHAIATASKRPIIDASLDALGTYPIVVAGEADMSGKPEPDLFLAGQKQLGVNARDCLVIGDAVWDQIAARRAGMLSVGVLTGGYAEEELYHAGAFHVYRDLADLLRNQEELGILN